MENNWKFYDLLSSICQDNNDSIIADGRQDGELIEQDVVEDMTETNDEVKRGKKHVDEEEYDEKKERLECTKKRKASKGRGNNAKKVRIEFLQKKKEGDKAVCEQPNEEEIPIVPKKKYSTLLYTQNVGVLNTPRLKNENNRKQQSQQQHKQTLRKTQTQ